MWSGKMTALCHSGGSVAKLLTLSTTMILTSASKSSLAQMCPLPITDPVALNTNAYTDDGSDIVVQHATDGHGNWLAIWNSTNSLEGTIGTDLDILFSGSADNGLTWTAPRPLHANAATDHALDFESDLATDGTGTWIGVWSSSADVGQPGPPDFDILFVRSTDNGASWSYPALVGDPDGVPDSGGDFIPQVTTDGSGNWVAVWESFDDLGGQIGFDRDVLVSQSSDNGVTWSAPRPRNARPDVTG